MIPKIEWPQHWDPEKGWPTSASPRVTSTGGSWNTLFAHAKRRGVHLRQVCTGMGKPGVFAGVRLPLKERRQAVIAALNGPMKGKSLRAVANYVGGVSYELVSQVKKELDL